MRKTIARLFLAHLDAQTRRRYRHAVASFTDYHRRAPQIARPQRFSENILWRKFFDRNPLFPVLQDKLAGKDRVRRLCPDMTVAPVLWQGTRAEDIPFDAFAHPYMVKCNHGAGFNIAVADPAKADRAAIVRRATELLSRQYGVPEHEWAYWTIAPRVFVEPLFATPDGAPPIEYRFTVIHGRVAYVAVDSHVRGSPATDYFDRNWGRAPAAMRGTPGNPGLAPPAHADRLRAAAETLAAGLDMLRVDFYGTQDNATFAEFTVYPLSAHVPFDPPGFDQTVGALWDIRRSHALAAPADRFARVYRRALDALAGDATPTPSAAANRNRRDARHDP